MCTRSCRVEDVVAYDSCTRTLAQAVWGRTWVVRPAIPKAVRGHATLPRGAYSLVLPILATPHIVACVSASQNAASLLRDLREQQGRSLRSAAADIGIAPSQLSRLERGQRGLAPEVSERLSDYYGVPSETLSLASGDVPVDILQILREHPDEIARLRSQYGSRLSE